MNVFPWLLSVVLFFIAVRHVITWVWLPWMLCAGLVLFVVVLLKALEDMFRR